MDKQVQSKAKVPDRLKTTTCWLYSHLDAADADAGAVNSVTLTTAQPVGEPQFSGAPEHADGSGANSFGAPVNGAPQEASLAELQEDYDVLGIVGESPVCRVYKVRNKRMGVIMALKVLKDEFATSAAAERQFQREVNAATTLCHPNIVPIYGHGRMDNNAAFVVEKLCDGAKNLAQVIKQDGALEPERALNLFRQIADAMEHAHTKAVTHGDLKPSNIVITGSAPEQARTRSADQSGEAQQPPEKPGETQTPDPAKKQQGEASLPQATINAPDPQAQKIRAMHLARLLAMVVCMVIVTSVIICHESTSNAWDSAFDDYGKAAGTADSAKTIEIAERMLSLADDRHMPVTMALAAEAYWYNGNDAKAHELLQKDVESCQKSKRYLSAINACGVDFDELVQSGNLEAARDSASVALNLVQASVVPVSWQETPLRVPEDSWTPIMSNRWLYPLMRNLGAADPWSSDNPEPAIESFGFKWTFTPPDRPMADYCKTFLEYGDAKDAQYVADQMMAHAKEIGLSDLDYGMYAAYSAIASYRLGDLTKAEAMKKVVEEKVNQSASSRLDADRLDWALMQLGAQCLASNDIDGAKHFFGKTPGNLIWSSKPTDGLLSSLVDKELNTWELSELKDTPHEVAPQIAEALARYGKTAQIKTMYETLLAGIAGAADQASWGNKWVPIAANYVDDMTSLKSAVDAHQARQVALNQIGQLMNDQLEDDDLNNSMSDALTHIFGSAATDKDLKQMQLAAALMDKLNAGKKSSYHDHARQLRAELPAYSGNINESIKQLTALLAARNSDDSAIAEDPETGDASDADIDIESHAALAKLYLLSNRPAQAIPHYQQAINLSHDCNDDPDEQAFLRVDLAGAYLQAGQIDLAKKQIESILPFRRRLAYVADLYFTNFAAQHFPGVLKKAPREVFPSDYANFNQPNWKALRQLADLNFVQGGSH